MSDITASERRLSAALDRIDQLLEQGTGRRAATTPDDGDLRAQLDAALAENNRLRAALAAGDGAASDNPEGRLADAGEQAARLVAANQELAAANRALIEAASGDGDRAEASSVALEAEIEALRAARAAEIAQLGDLMVELERLLSEEGAAPAGAVLSSASVEMTADQVGVPDVEDDDEIAEDADEIRNEGR